MAEAVAQNTKWKGLLVPALKKVGCYDILFCYTL